MHSLYGIKWDGKIIMNGEKERTWKWCSQSWHLLGQMTLPQFKPITFYTQVHSITTTPTWLIILGKSCLFVHMFNFLITRNGKALLLHIQKVLNSNLKKEIGYPNYSFLSFSLSCWYLKIGHKYFFPQFSKIILHNHPVIPCLMSYKLSRRHH